MYLIYQILFLDFLILLIPSYLFDSHNYNYVWYLINVFYKNNYYIYIYLLTIQH